MEVIGRIRMIGFEQQVSPTFTKREVVITTEEQYPQHILIEFTQDKCNLLELYQVGDLVVVGINIRGREWANPQGVTRYFNTIQGWRINAVGQPVQQQGYTQPGQHFQGQYHNNSNQQNQQPNYANTPQQ